MKKIQQLLKSAYSNLEPREALQRPVDILLGVSSQAREALVKLEIHSVFDLALSVIFQNASKLLSSKENPVDSLVRYGSVPSDFIDSSAENSDVATLAGMDIQVLAGIGPITGPEIKNALQVQTVRDLALWPAYEAAKLIFQEAFNPENTPDYDSEAPAELLPKAGVYPTERVFYETILLDQILDDPSGMQPLEGAGPVDVTASAGEDFGFKKPAVGAILKHSQTWYTQGVALGQLLHSVALAPGESTKIAMLDWSRHTKTNVDENISETERLANIMNHNRSISEVTKAVANEAQSGFSNTASRSSSAEVGAGLGGAIGGFLFGAAGGYGQNDTQAASFATSSGRRDITANMLQNIADSTQQNANGARNRRASIVKEVSQAESEKVTTRVITNYNHMHALSVQYYEVVQLYRVVMQLSDVDKCLFIPMKVLNFGDPNVVQRFKSVLAAASLTPLMQQMLISEAEQFYVKPMTVDPLPPKPEPMPPTPKPGQPPGGVVYIPDGRYWLQHIQRLTAAVGTEVLQKDGQYKLPPGIQILGFYMGYSYKTYTIERRNGSSISGERPVSSASITFAEPVLLDDIMSVTFNFENADTNPSYADLYLKANVKGNVIEIHIPVAYPAQGGIVKALVVSPGLKGGSDLTQHLKANALYYSQAVWRNLDSATLSLLLSPFKFEGKPVMQLIAPKPVAVAGNFLAFRMHSDPVADPAWATWLQEHGIDRSAVKQEIIPLPSGGVFAEAVLGRYNAAEKLDMTRFWNWQDSPIPNQAPEIAPVQVITRALPDDTKPGQLSQPVIQITQPAPLPDPAGISAILTAIQNGNMFRDMSGLAATIGLAQAGLTAASAGASHAAGQAGTNMNTAAQYQIEMLKSLLPLITSAMGATTGAGGGKTNISEDGAKYNEGKKIDEKNGKAPNAGEDGTGGSGQNGADPGSNGGGKGQGTGVIPAVYGSGSHAIDAFNQSLGNSGALYSLLGSLLQNIIAAMPPAATKSVLTLGQKVPNKNEADVVGAISGKIVRGTPEFENLVTSTNVDIVFKDEEGTGADKVMSKRMKEKLDKLAELVKKEWPSLKLRVTECWDENNEHSSNSTHYEGRGADLTTSDVDKSKLGRLGQLAVDAGLDWVFYENDAHIHVSVKKDESPAGGSNNGEIQV
ncbi:hypothetical protein DCC85_11105 [Paenibacillus sp. CAA11]|uniref:hypothetical protein n=1 Tax=Paenibacillus sp. CAA11 TaxID=1532905 RepID=UPI000D3387E2|nr:hypothetical protein [Paenibacillus sp. CAA11]AWB44709.1 hypothetical protein DCC85_11105 [Paenibacillus sp. CAA11]